MGHVARSSPLLASGQITLTIAMAVPLVHDVASA
jgi:hypothetical protein